MVSIKVTRRAPTGSAKGRLEIDSGFYAAHDLRFTLTSRRIRHSCDPDLRRRLAFDQVAVCIDGLNALYHLQKCRLELCFYRLKVRLKTKKDARC